MAEIVEYRVEKTVDELNLLVEFGIFTEDDKKEILAKRQNFEYTLRRRNKSKLDYLRYIRFEVNLLEALDKYKKQVISDYYAKKDADKLEELERRILLLQAKKLNDIIRSRCAHISSLFRKLTTSFQFDEKLWLAYIDFAKSRGWNTRVSSLYWRLLRVKGDREDIWIAAALHEVRTNKTFDIARGLFLRALRHHQTSLNIWIEYIKMEIQFMEIVDRRARIIFKMSENTAEKQGDGVDIWVDDEKELKQTSGEDSAEIELEQEESNKKDEDPIPQVKLIDEDDMILTGHLPKIIYNNSVKTFKSQPEFNSFVVGVLDFILSCEHQTKGLLSLQEHICTDLKRRYTEADPRVSKELATCCENLEDLKKYILQLKNDSPRPQKRLKNKAPSKLEQLYECYESQGIHAARNLFNDLEKSVKNQTLSLYVGMIQIETWRYEKDKSDSQLNRVRSIYDKAITKFGTKKAKLWYEYLQLEHDRAKSLEDFERINQMYQRAQSTLHPSKVDKVIEKFTMLQVKTSSADIEYSDYSDLDD